MLHLGLQLHSLLLSLGISVTGAPVARQSECVHNKLMPASPDGRGGRAESSCQRFLQSNQTVSLIFRHI